MRSWILDIALYRPCLPCGRAFFSGQPPLCLLFCDQKSSRKVPLLPRRGARLRGLRGCEQGATVERSETGERAMFAPAGRITARAGLRSKLAALVVRRQAPGPLPSGKRPFSLTPRANNVRPYNLPEGECLPAGRRALDGAQRAPSASKAGPLVRLFAPQGQTLLAPQFLSAQLWPRARNPATPEFKVEEGAGALRTKSNTAFV